MNNLSWLAPLIAIGARRAASTSRWVRSRLTHAKMAYGQGLVEYALILVLIAIVSIGVLTELGGKTSEVFDTVNCTLAGGSPASTTTTGPGSSSSHTSSSSSSSAATTTTTGDC